MVMPGVSDIFLELRFIDLILVAMWWQIDLLDLVLSFFIAQLIFVSREVGAVHTSRSNVPI
jgi:Co/Zn/Cd efflux system component